MNPAIRTTIVMSVLAVVFATGCEKPEPPVGLTSEKVILGENGDYDLLWSTCRQTIREKNFRTSRADPVAGVITTWPVTSQQFFEFWRKDVDTPWDFLEASLNTVRRRVRVDLVREESGDVTVSVTVNKEQLSAMDRQYNSTASVFRSFSPKMPSAATGRQIRPGDDVWIDDGRDGAMEQWLLNQIMLQYQQEQALYADAK